MIATGLDDCVFKKEEKEKKERKLVEYALIIRRQLHK